MHIDHNLAVEGTRRAVAIADEVFPATFKPDIPDAVRISIALLARCLTTTKACLHLVELGRRSDLMVCVRTLYEHTVTLAWLLGGNDAEHRMLLWERYCDEQAVRLDDDVVRLGGEPSIPAGTRAQMAAAAIRLGGARMPGLADRAILADREWAERLGLDPTHRDAASLRRVYSVIFRVASAVAHPTLAGLQFVAERRPDRVTIGVEPAGRAHEAMLPVPLLIGTALTVSAQALGKPSIQQMNAYFEWLTDAGAT
jgi:hypothetical protein